MLRFGLPLLGHRPVLHVDIQRHAVHVQRNLTLLISEILITLLDVNRIERSSCPPAGVVATRIVYVPHVGDGRVPAFLPVGQPAIQVEVSQPAFLDRAFVTRMNAQRTGETLDRLFQGVHRFTGAFNERQSIIQIGLKQVFLNHIRSEARIHAAQLLKICRGCCPVAQFIIRLSLLVERYQPALPLNRAGQIMGIFVARIPLDDRQ